MKTGTIVIENLRSVIGLITDLIWLYEAIQHVANSCT